MISFEKETINAGMVPCSYDRERNTFYQQRVSGYFVFMNAGDAVLNFYEADSNASVVVRYPHYDIGPGNKDSLEVLFSKNAEQPGNFSNIIHVKGNFGTVLLRVTGILYEEKGRR
ncbi:MAG TPA: hypothetical protein VI112_03430 [Bacteroidia bacterium]